MFNSGDSRAVWSWVWTLKYLKWALHYLHDAINRTSWGPDWSFRRCFCSRKRCIRLWRCDDDMTLESTQPTPFCLKKTSVKKMDNLMFLQRFQCKSDWNKVKYARITITHICFIALTLAGSLERCLTTRPIDLVFKQHPLTWQMLKHKRTCVIPIMETNDKAI